MCTLYFIYVSIINAYICESFPETGSRIHRQSFPMINRTGKIVLLFFNVNNNTWEFTTFEGIVLVVNFANSCVA